jgi:hypothetical protein
VAGFTVMTNGDSVAKDLSQRPALNRLAALLRRGPGDRLPEQTGHLDHQDQAQPKVAASTKLSGHLAVQIT